MEEHADVVTNVEGFALLTHAALQILEISLLPGRMQGQLADDPLCVICTLAKYALTCQSALVTLNYSRVREGENQLKTELS